ncbi:MAG: hypothetical protein ACRERX_00055 [Pseudomonas sp.]
MHDTAPKNPSRGLTLLLPLALSCELIAISAGPKELGMVAAVLFGLFFLGHWRSLMPYPRRLGLITLALLVCWAAAGKASPDGAARLAESAAYYATFIASLCLMQCLVRRQPQLAGLHRLLLAGSPVFRYPRYVLSSLAIGSVLSFGVLNLLCGSLNRHLEILGVDEPAASTGRRGVLVATLRGYALIPLLAPTSVAVAILTRELSGLSWLGLLPYGGVAAALLLLVGWYQDNRHLQDLNQHDEVSGTPGLGRLLGASLLGIGCMLVLAALTHLTATQAALLLVPCGIGSYLLWVERSPMAVCRELTDTVAGVRNEIFIFACSTLLGGLVSQLVSLDGMADLLVRLPAGLFLVEAAGLIGIILLALLGVAPIISLSLISGLLVHLAEQGLPMLGPAIALLCGYSLAILLSPFSPSALLLARYANVSTTQVALYWNGHVALWAVIPVMLLAMLA